jgi:hypothetical protein
MNGNLLVLNQAPPSDLLAERFVLASVLLFPELFHGLGVDLFYSAANQEIFLVLLGMARENIPFDFPAISAELTKRKFDNPETLARLDQLLNDSASGSNIDYHVRMLREKSYLRKILTGSYELQNLVSGEAPLAEISDKLDGLKKSITHSTNESCWSTSELSPCRFFESEPKPFEFIIPKFLPRGIVGFTYGAGGAYKSLAMLWLVIQRAIYEYDNGQKWLDKFPLDAPGRSIFFSAEDVEIDLHHRVQNIVSRIHDNRPDVPLEVFQRAISENCLIVSREQWTRGGELFIVDAEGERTLKTNSIVQIIKDFDADFSVFETYSRIAPVDEIDNRTAARVVGVFEEMRDITQGTFTVIAHSSKINRGTRTDTNDQNSLRGAGALLDNARWGLSFRALPRGDADNDQIEITHSKSFRCKRTPSFTVEATYPSFTLVEKTEPKGKSVVEFEKVKEIIGSKTIWSNTELKRVIMEKTGISISTAKRRIGDAIECGYLVKNCDGTYSPDKQE